MQLGLFAPMSCINYGKTELQVDNGFDVLDLLIHIFECLI